MAYAMGQRTREIGIRMALGARRVDVLLMMLRQALLPVGFGLLAGLAIALAISRIFAGLLYEVTSTDPVTYVSVCTLLLAVAAVAADIPARHATRVDPLIAFSCERFSLSVFNWGHERTVPSLRGNLHYLERAIYNLRFQ